MKIKINVLNWEVEFLDGDDERLVYDGDECFGLTVFSDLHIYIRKDRPKEGIKHVITHELIHAFLYSYGIHLPLDEEETEEAACDFVAMYLDQIYKMSNQIYKFFEKEVM